MSFWENRSCYSNGWATTSHRRLCLLTRYQCNRLSQTTGYSPKGNLESVERKWSCYPLISHSLHIKNYVLFTACSVCWRMSWNQPTLNISTALFPLPPLLLSFVRSLDWHTDRPTCSLWMAWDKNECYTQSCSASLGFQTAILGQNA